MRLDDIKKHHQAFDLKWDGDNSGFITRILIPNLKLSEYDKQVMMWAYGAFPVPGSYEMQSDGETLVKDYFLNGVIKCPAGTTHDYLNRCPNHKTPDGHIWKPTEANALYRRIMKALGYPFCLRWRRWLGVTVSIWYWWKDDKKKK